MFRLTHLESTSVYDDIVATLLEGLIRGGAEETLKVVKKVSLDDGSVRFTLRNFQGSVLTVVSLDYGSIEFTFKDLQVSGVDMDGEKRSWRVDASFYVYFSLSREVDKTFSRDEVEEALTIEGVEGEMFTRFDVRLPDEYQGRLKKIVVNLILRHLQELDKS